MAKTRKDLQAELEELLGSHNVYFQPPASITMKYPAIVYHRNDIDNVHADNSVYRQTHVYRLTVIDRNPDSEIVAKVSKLPGCRFNTHFEADNLNHDVFILNY